MAAKVIPQIAVAAWRNLLQSVYNASKIGAGAIALVSLVDDLRFKAHAIRNAISDDQYIKRGLGTWDADYAGLSARIEGYIATLQRAVVTPDPSVRNMVIYGEVANPILNGQFPAAFLATLPVAARAGIVVDPKTGDGRNFGDAIMAATLWNQAVYGRDTDALAPFWAISSLRGVITETLRQLEISGPGDDPTATDAVVNALNAASTGAGNLLSAIGSSKVVLVVVGVTVLGVLLWAWRTR
jgi:hypothetical protein